MFTDRPRGSFLSSSGDNLRGPLKPLRIITAATFQRFQWAEGGREREGLNLNMTWPLWCQANMRSFWCHILQLYFQSYFVYFFYSHKKINKNWFCVRPIYADRCAKSIYVINQSILVNKTKFGLKLQFSDWSQSVLITFA